MLAILALKLENLFDPNADASDLPVLGIRVGDEAEKLRGLLIESGEPNGKGIVHGTGGPWRELADGSREKLSIDEVIDLVTTDSGRLWCDGVVFNVKDTRVTGIALRGHQLESLGVDTESEVFVRFGEPSHYESQYGSSSSYYPSRDLRIVFDLRANHLDAVLIGPFDLPALSRSEFRFGGRATATLVEIRQHVTHEGLLEGLPTHEMNEKGIANSKTNAEKEYGMAVEVIEPAETPIPYDGDRPYPFGTPAKLPSVECVGRFFRSQFARDKTKDFSQLVVVWYQEDFAFPIAPEIIKKFEALRWDALATDGDW